VGLYSTTSDSAKVVRSSFYENMSAINEVEEPEPVPLPYQQPEAAWSDEIQIGITITEPASEMNDSNIVPDDLFDYAHEKPPGSLTGSQSSLVNNNSVNCSDNNRAPSLTNLSHASYNNRCVFCLWF
jgi:hypothetical protein